MLDGFSRMPLAVAVFSAEPSAKQMARLLRDAANRFGSARYLITDQGSQFTASAFRAAVESLGMQHRFGAIGQSGSIALIERFWRTLKQSLRSTSVPPLTRRALEQRLRPVLFHYSYVRPHQGLDGTTPAECFFALKAAGEDAQSPPRARPREGPSEHPFTIGFIDHEQRLPYIIRTAA